MTPRFHDRHDAGRQLAARLGHFADRPDVIVLGLPRGGVVVAAEVAAALHAPLDALVVRKLGVPGHEELAMGAIASGGIRVLDELIVRELRISPAAIEAVEASERAELERRESLYRGNRSMPELNGKIAIIVDDGLATGSTMRAAIGAVRLQQPEWIVCAVPVASRGVLVMVEALVDEVVCLEIPEPFLAVGLRYTDFSPTSDKEVVHLLRAEHSGNAADSMSRA
jgi:putative phosphoribosyl transferase